MTVLTPPRHPLVDQALITARQWCADKIIDDHPALAHAVRVAVTIGAYEPEPTPDVIAAALLHDAPEFAPAHLHLDRFLARRYGAEVGRLVRGMQIEHDALDRQQPVIPDAADIPLLLISTADKIVALSSLLRRAHLSGDINGFFATRRPLLQLLTHFRACQHAATGTVPSGLTTALASILDAVETATSSSPSCV